ncbi:Rz1-like lysis system protein LysC [Ursidibacter sp. B-7004-1]
MALAGCSTNEAAHYRTIKPLPLACPPSQQCQMPKFQLKNNGDLVIVLDKALTTIEFCQIELKSWAECVEGYNRNLKGKPTLNGE